VNNRSQVESAILHFFDALNSDNISGLPLAQNVEYYGILVTEPVRGESEVRDHLQQIAPFILNVSNRKMIIDKDSGAVLTKVEGVNGVHVDGAYFLKVEDGKISEIRAIFDSRPLFAGSKG